MSNTQYTIRAVPKKLDQALRARARQTGKSLNSVVLEYLSIASGTTDESAVFNDLDWFYRSKKTKDAGFDDMQAWLDKAPKGFK